MADLTHLFEIGQHVKYKNDDFDAVKKFIPCVVKETYPDHIIITDTETNTDLWCKKELENLNEFINHWDDKLLEKDEDFYRYWFEKVGSAFGKIAEVCKTKHQR